MYWFLFLCKKIFKTKGESSSIVFFSMSGYAQSNTERVYNGQNISGEKKEVLFFVHVQSMGIPSNLSVMKMTII